MAHCIKTSYSTEQFALDDIALIAKKSKRTESPKNAYLCKKCNTWHITKQETLEGLKRELAQKDELLKSREEEFLRLKAFVGNLEKNRINALGTNDLQIKIRILEKEIIDNKAIRASYGKKFNDISVKLNTVKNIVNKGIKKGYSLQEFIDKIKNNL